MDVDVIQPTRNSPFIHYFDVSESFPWQEPRPEQIRLRRASMDDTLIFDILLTAGEVGDPYVLYPPETPEALQQLLDAIEVSNYDLLKKDCLIYFLLKWHQDGRERTFQEQRCIPPQFVALADAYWHLDTGINVQKAVALLSDPRLNRDYASKIIRAISLSPDSARLIRRYVQTAKPLLVEPPDIEYYALALADRSLLDAWQFARTFNERDTTRTRLLHKIFEWSISPQPRPIPLKQLITLPLSSFEEKILKEFVQKPPVVIPFSSIAVLQDLICVRLIQSGRYAEAIKLDRLFSSTTSQKHAKDTRGRSSMVQDVYNALPAVEKALLDLDLDPTIHPQRPLTAKPISPETQRTPAVPASEHQDNILSQSWGEVRVPESLVPKSSPLRDIRVPTTTTTTPRYNGATPNARPVFPLNFNSVASGSKSTPSKTLPLAASVSSSAQPIPSFSGVGARMAFGTPNAIASPASGIKLPRPSLGSSHGPGHTFLSASQQQNAFYRPPVKSNGSKRAFEDDSAKRPAHVEVSPDADSPTADVEMEPEEHDGGHERQRTKRGRKSDIEDSEEEGDVLSYSVFGAKNKSPKSNPTMKQARQDSPPGAYKMDEDEDRDQDQEIEQRKRTRKTRSGRTTQKVLDAGPSKPPAKKVKQTKDVVRNIPGGLMEEDEDEEEHDDQVVPLPARTSRRGGGGGKGKAVSVDTTDEMEGGMQTRRRSTRLNAAGSSGSVRGISPDPAVAPKTRKAGRGAAGTRKKR